MLICVSDTPDVDQVLFGENGVLHGAQPGALVVDHSTISPQATKAMAARLAAAGVQMLDAPVSGGSEGAAKGTLSIMVGGPADQFAACPARVPGHGQDDHPRGRPSARGRL